MAGRNQILSELVTEKVFSFLAPLTRLKVQFSLLGCTDGVVWCTAQVFTGTVIVVRLTSREVEDLYRLFIQGLSLEGGGSNDLLTVSKRTCELHDTELLSVISLHHTLIAPTLLSELIRN